MKAFRFHRDKILTNLPNPSQAYMAGEKEKKEQENKKDEKLYLQISESQKDHHLKFSNQFQTKFPSISKSSKIENLKNMIQSSNQIQKSFSFAISTIQNVFFLFQRTKNNFNNAFIAIKNLLSVHLIIYLTSNLFTYKILKLMMKLVLIMAVVCLMLPSIHSLRVYSHDSSVVTTKAQFDSLVSSLNKPYVLYFWADWCIPCKMLDPVIQKRERLSNGRWVIIKLDVDLEDLSEIINNHQVSRVPTLAFYRGAEKVFQYSGFMDDAGLKKLEAKYLY